MTDFMNLPTAVAEKIEGKAYQRNDIGRSDSLVLVFDDMVLKIEKTSEISDNEYAMLRWLEGKLPVPHVITFEQENGYNYLLMTKLSGSMACEKRQSTAAVVRGLAAGLKMLWALDISDCPKKQTVTEKLMQAKRRMESGCLGGHAPDGSSDVYGCSDFASLYAYLSENRPEEALVFSHGDYCLPNVFLSGESVMGFLDLGSAGIADKWYDISLCLWSMHYNFCELGDMAEKEFEKVKALLFAELGMAFDEKKVRYYNLLDEFFMCGNGNETG